MNSLVSRTLLLKRQKPRNSTHIINNFHVHIDNTTDIYVSVFHIYHLKFEQLGLKELENSYQNKQ